MSDDLNIVSTATGKVSVNGIPVPDDLRTRIMRALFRTGVPVSLIGGSADEVIAELKLRPDRELDYGSPGASPPRTRYVTDWRADVDQS